MLRIHSIHEITDLGNKGRGGGKGEFLHFFAEGLNPSGSYMVTEGEKRKVPHAQPAAVGAAEEIPFQVSRGPR